MMKHKKTFQVSKTWKVYKDTALLFCYTAYRHTGISMCIRFQ